MKSFSAARILLLAPTLLYIYSSNSFANEDSCRYDTVAGILRCDAAPPIEPWQPDPVDPYDPNPDPYVDEHSDGSNTGTSQNPTPAPAPTPPKESREKCVSRYQAEESTCIANAKGEYSTYLRTDCEDLRGGGIDAGPVSFGVYGEVYDHCVNTGEADRDAEIARCTAKKDNDIYRNCP